MGSLPSPRLRRSIGRDREGRARLPRALRRESFQEIPETGHAGSAELCRGRRCVRKPDRPGSRIAGHSRRVARRSLSAGLQSSPKRAQPEHRGCRCRSQERQFEIPLPALATVWAGRLGYCARGLESWSEVRGCIPWQALSAGLESRRMSQARSYELPLAAWAAFRPLWWGQWDRSSGASLHRSTYLLHTRNFGRLRDRKRSHDSYRDHAGCQETEPSNNL
jgi:hypothetical protein